MSKRAVFLDRDGTINVEKNYLHKIDDFEFLPGVIEGLKLLQEAGYLLIIITNQSGIARGYYSEEDFYTLTKWMMDELQKNGVKIEKVYFCPHLPDALVSKYRTKCSCRKPGLGMYEQAIKEFDIDLNNSFTIGDKIRDCKMCEKTGCRGFLISDNENEDIIYQVKHGQIVNVNYAFSLLDCARKIIEMETF